MKVLRSDCSAFTTQVCHNNVNSSLLGNSEITFLFSSELLESFHDCLPILMLLYIMFVYLMLFAALYNAVCLNNGFFFIDFCKCFLSSCFVLVY